MKSLNLIFAATIALAATSCGKAKYGFTGQKAEPTDQNQNFTEEQPQGNIAPNEYRGTDGFFLKGTPGTVDLGEDVTFTGSCGNKKGELVWKFGDGIEGKGTEIKHRYKKTGSFEIEGICTYEDGSTQEGTITISVVPKKNIDSKNGGTQKPNQSPGQSPIQCPIECP